MESVGFSESAKDEMAVFKDAFAPQQPSRIIRAWERAPVPATLPHLQGQKIWKRNGVKSQRENDKENFEASQHELRTEGMGARKRVRLLGAKENIRDATWSQNLEHSCRGQEAAVARERGATGLKDTAAAPCPLNDADSNALQSVPRKRTNTNHVITPRKPWRQTTLNAQAQQFVRSPHPSPEQPRRRKSMRKSIRKSIAAHISDVPAVVAENPIVTEERDRVEPLRNSSVKAPIVNHSVVEQLEIVPQKPPNGNTDKDEGRDVSLVKPASEDPEVDSRLEVSTGIESPTTQTQSQLENNVDRLLNDKLNVLFDLDAGTATSQHALPKPEQDLGNDEESVLDTVGKASQTNKVPLNESPDVDDSPWSPSQRSISQDPENKSIRHTDQDQPSRDCEGSETPSQVFQSIETDTDSCVERQASKTTNAPKRTRGSSQRRGIRRSTRNARASSVRAEERTIPVGSAAMPLNTSTDEITPKQPASISYDTKRKLNSMESSESASLVEDSQTHHDQRVACLLIPESTPSDDQGSIQAPVSSVADITTNLEATQPPEISFKRADAIELGEFDVSAQLTLQLCGDSQQNHVVIEDFELQPVSASKMIAFPDSLPNETRQKSIPESPAALGLPRKVAFEDSSPVTFSPIKQLEARSTLEIKESAANVPGYLDTPPKSTETDATADESETVSPSTDDLPGSSTPDPTTSKLVETISENALAVAYDHDDTNMLRSFLDRVQANKAAKASTSIPKRKRSLPHSPIQLPLGENNNISPSPRGPKEGFDLGSSGPSPSKRRKVKESVLADEDDTITERKASRRSGRTRLPVIKASLGAPSHIPVRRLGQDGDTTVTLKHTEEKELAALTRLNTRKNKAGSQSVPEYLAKKAQEKEDPALRQRLLKEVFDEKAQKAQRERKKTVVWAEELTHYQTVEGRKLDGGKEETKETEKLSVPEAKKGAVKVGVRSKIALGMAVNGTPAPKRKKRAP